MAETSDQQSAFSYDDEGQLAGVNADVYTFDYEHRMTAISGQQSAFSFFYDGKGNRLKAVRNGVTTKYVYDMSGNMLAEADSSNNITAIYIYSGGSLLARVSPTDQVYTYHFNPIGSTVAITDQSQNVANKYSYDSYGNVLNQVEAVPQPFKYVGQYGVTAETNGFIICEHVIKTLKLAVLSLKIRLGSTEGQSTSMNMWEIIL